MLTRIALGTAAFGMDYGITNADGRVGNAEVKAILSMARACGIDLLDTAPGYDEAEKILGASSEADEFKVITKLPGTTGSVIHQADIVAAVDSVERSLAQLARPRIDSLLLHDAGDLRKSGARELLARLSALKAEGVIGKLGVSVYDPEDVDMVYGVFEPDIVQIPCNLLDRRFPDGGYLEMIVERGGEVHARSAFLQGLLLQDVDALPDWCRPWLGIFNELRNEVNRAGLSPLQACLGFLLNNSLIERIVIGVTHRAELQQIMAAVSELHEVTVDISHLPLGPRELIDPRRW